MPLKMSPKLAGQVLEETADAASDLKWGAAIGTGLAVGIGLGTGSDAKQLAADVVGAGGQELLEYAVKKGLQKQATGILAKQASAGVVKQAMTTTATKVVAGQVAKQTTAAALRSTLVSGAKMVGGGLAKAALAMAGGPIGLALLLISLTLGFMDMFWNPWKNYFNKDLDDMMNELNNSASSQFKAMGYTYPTTIKPNISPETKEEIEEYQKELSAYLTDRNLIMPEQAYVQLVNRLNDMKDYRARRFDLTDAHLELLRTEGTSKFAQQEEDASSQQRRDFVEASRMKNQIADKMSHYVFISVTQEDIKTNRTQLMLYTSLLYKKGIILPPSERGVLTDIKQYLQVYWFRFVFYICLFVSIVFSIIFYRTFKK